VSGESTRLLHVWHIPKDQACSHALRGRYYLLSDINILPPLLARDLWPLRKTLTQTGRYVVCSIGDRSMSA
jgi:hypothetical protein